MMWCTITILNKRTKQKRQEGVNLGCRSSSRTTSGTRSRDPPMLYLQALGTAMQCTAKTGTKYKAPGF